MAAFVVIDALSVKDSGLIAKFETKGCVLPIGYSLALVGAISILAYDALASIWELLDKTELIIL